MSVPIIDAQAFPLVRVTFGPTISLADIREFGRQVRLLVRRGPVGSVTHLHQLDLAEATAVKRQLFAREMDAIAATGKIVAEAVIVRSTVMAGLVTAYSWLRPGQVTPRCFTEEEAAETWIRGQLVARGVLPG